MKVIGRKRQIKRITNFAISEPENKAFFGVKGVGKSTVIQSVFSKSHCKEYAEDYRYLFVRTILNPKMKGDILIDFLFDCVLNGIDLISDETIVEEIHDRIEVAKKRFQSKDSILRDTLENIKDYEYSLILIMDDFHNMGRSDVGSEQYDFLRSLNELGLMHYWIVSDSDFSDVYATSQFTTSFFAQKFIPETFPQMVEEDIIEMLRNKLERYDLEYSDDVLQLLYSIIEGVPAFVDPAVMCYESLENISCSEDELIDSMLVNPKCESLMTVWSRSLTKEQKDILYSISTKGKIYEDSNREIMPEINKLGDHSGLGLLVHGTDDNGKFWRLNTKLYKEFIIRKTDVFYSTGIKENNEKDPNSGIPTNATYIQNNYYTVNNNFFNPDAALEALISLKSIVGSTQPIGLPSDGVVTAALQQLPYQQPGWEALDEKQQDEQMEEYAEKIFESDDFGTEALSDNQMIRFHLTEEILGFLPELSKKNLISAIQVYDLLQFCVDKFGLDMSTSESARGILFARAYESILKECLKPAMCTVDTIANKNIVLERSSYSFADAPVGKMTIGNFVFVLNDRKVQSELADVCVNQLGNTAYDQSWWRTHQSDMYKVSMLRNDCCHSGSNFDGTKLNQLIQFLFDLNMIADVQIYNEINNR